MNRIVHFEIATDDIERAADFYRSTFGWEINKWDGPMTYHTVMTGAEGTPGINGGLVGRNGPDMPGVINTIDVESVDDTLEKVTAAGGSIVMPKGPIPTIGWLAYCKDTEGNIFGVMQTDPNAA